MVVVIESSLVKEPLSFEQNLPVQISVVAYGHCLGIPARFCAGLVPAIDLADQLKQKGVHSSIRLIDPTPIANFCNGWQSKQPQQKFREVASRFLTNTGVDYFYDEAEPICDASLEVLNQVALEFDRGDNSEVADLIGRIRESGRKHGGETGVKNAALYMAAHPFSWLGMHHPLIWKMSFLSGSLQFVNLKSKSEERYSAICQFLQMRRIDMCTNHSLVESYMSICDTPCYIPLEEEPMVDELIERGYLWCHGRYHELRKKSSNHKRALKDFEVLMSFLGLNAG